MLVLEMIQKLDGNLLLAIQQLHIDWLNPIVAVFTQMGDVGLLWIICSALMLCWKPTRKAGALALMALVLGALCTNLTIKPLVERARPWVDLPILPLVAEDDPHSFPSGHTCAAFAAGMIWMRTLPWKWTRVFGVVMAVCMGLSRLYVGVHYPSDVLVGALVGSFCAWVVWSVYRRWGKNRLG